MDFLTWLENISGAALSDELRHTSSILIIAFWGTMI